MMLQVDDVSLVCISRNVDEIFAYPWYNLIEKGNCIFAPFLSAPAPAPVQLSLGDACDPTDVTNTCSSGTICQNVSWVEYYGTNGEYSDFVDASISHGLKYEYYVDHVEGYICTFDW